MQSFDLAARILFGFLDGRALTLKPKILQCDLVLIVSS
jgi:hypothetical protein